MGTSFMVEVTRWLILFSVVLFAAYSQQVAGTEVKSMKSWKRQSDLDKSFIKRTVQNNDHRFGCILVNGGKISGEAYSVNAALHVEAIQQACQSISRLSLCESTLYMSAEPCSLCLSVIDRAGIERVCYLRSESTVRESDTLVTATNLRKAASIWHAQPMLLIPIRQEEISSIDN